MYTRLIGYSPAAKFVLTVIIDPEDFSSSDGVEDPRD